jgi:hypothetical protein
MKVAIVGRGILIVRVWKPAKSDRPRMLKPVVRHRFRNRFSPFLGPFFHRYFRPKTGVRERETA